MDFPENAVAVFVDYLPDTLQQALAVTRAELARVSRPNVPVVDEFKETFPRKLLSAIEANRQRRAEATVLVRRQLIAMIDGLNGPAAQAVLAVMGDADAKVVRHDVVEALNALEPLLQSTGPAEIPAVGAAFSAVPIVFATLDDDVRVLHNGTTVDIKVRGPDVTLPGFSVSARLSEQDLAEVQSVLSFLSGGPERRFRIGLMRGELKVAAGRPQDGLGEHLALLTDPDVDTTRRKAVALRAGFAGLALGDAAFRRASADPADPRRLEATSEYAAAVTRLDDHGVAPDNPIRVQIEQQAVLREAMLTAGLNVLGYHDGYVPVLRPAALQERTERHLAAADAAVARFVEFKQEAQRIEDALAQLDFDRDVKTIELSIADEEIARCQDQLEIATTRGQQIADQQARLTDTTIAAVGGSLLQAAAAAFLAGTAGPIVPDSGVTGTSVTGIVGALSGGASAAAGYAARRADLEFQQTIAGIERTIAEREATIAVQRRAIAEATLNFTGEQIARIQARDLSADLLFAAAGAFRVMAEQHLETATKWAYLFERSVIFLRLVPDEHRIRFDYAVGPGGLLTAVAALRADVETVADLNLPITKFQFLTETYSLRSLFPVEFAGLLSTGQMDFTLSLYEMSKRRPGVYRQRIKRVDIELQFPPPSGFTGRIRHSGSFLLRDRDTALQAQTFMPTVGELQAALDALGAGASQGIPIGGVIPFVLDVDTIELSPNPTPPALSDPDPDALMPIEGYGPAGDWRLEIENVDLRFISDALMHVTYVIPESDQPLATKVKSLLAAYETGVLLPGDARDLISTFALRTRFPAALGQLASGSALLTFAAHDFPAGITGRRLKTVVVQALDASRAGVSGVVVELTKPGTAFAVQRTTSADGFTESLAGAVPVLDSADRPDVDGDYELRVPDPAQLSRIDDLLLLFVYEFREVT